MSRYDYRDPGTDPDYCDALSNPPERERDDDDGRTYADPRAAE